MNKLHFNNKESLKDFDLIIVNSIEYPMIVEDIESIEVEGRTEGSLTIKTGNYKNLNISVTFRLLKMDNYKNRIRKINMWLTNIKNNTLYFSDYDERCYKVKYVQLGNMIDSNFTSADITVNFVLLPFIYSNRESFLTIENNSDIYYDGDVNGEPDIILKISDNPTNISFFINDREFQFRDVTGEITILSSNMLAIDQDKRQLSRKMIGNFPYLEPGENRISWTGDIEKVMLNKKTLYRG